MSRRVDWRLGQTKCSLFLQSVLVRWNVSVRVCKSGTASPLQRPKRSVCHDVASFRGSARARRSKLKKAEEHKGRIGRRGKIGSKSTSDRQRDGQDRGEAQLLGVALDSAPKLGDAINPVRCNARWEAAVGAATDSRHRALRPRTKGSVISKQRLLHGFASLHAASLLKLPHHSSADTGTGKGKSSTRGMRFHIAGKGYSGRRITRRGPRDGDGRKEQASVRRASAQASSSNETNARNMWYIPVPSNVRAAEMARQVIQLVRIECPSSDSNTVRERPWVCAQRGHGGVSEATQPKPASVLRKPVHALGTSQRGANLTSRAQGAGKG
ncbi:hypothetical protein M440DRAFT_1460133 [Trichoderma longibrachiatum ATCC 18648]|uniref:Uncharacterized protein n=1 Tax=Trichoderma longibrachiatum ATCC 18648 TaxID=983965 RepID=A0A2T4CEW0_TRILO|nr:hypothetical protein M440DRAFT_1460133 [Trichoderma longibrachiatum ATCC 18648]